MCVIYEDSLACALETKEVVMILKSNVLMEIIIKNPEKFEKCVLYRRVSLPCAPHTKEFLMVIICNVLIEFCLKYLFKEI